MKFNMKVVAASVLFAVAGTSQAAILNGGDAFNAAQDDGELFISIFRDTASPESMIIDTNVSLFGARDGLVSGWTSSADQTAAILSFLGTASSTSFRFNAGGVTNQADVFDPTHNADFAAWFTASTPTTIDNLPNNGSGVNSVRSKIGTFVADINNAYASTEVVAGLNPGEFGFHKAGEWGNQVGSTLSFSNTEGSIGTDLPVYNLFTSCTDMFCEGFSVQQFGSLSINGQTGQASWALQSAPPAVPVPAAAWLLGSGLIGLIGVARRRTA